MEVNEPIETHESLQAQKQETGSAQVVHEKREIINISTNHTPHGESLHQNNAA